MNEGQRRLAHDGPPPKLRMEDAWQNYKHRAFTCMKNTTLGLLYFGKDRNLAKGKELCQTKRTNSIIYLQIIQRSLTPHCLRFLKFFSLTGHCFHSTQQLDIHDIQESQISMMRRVRSHHLLEIRIVKFTNLS